MTKISPTHSKILDALASSDVGRQILDRGTAEIGRQRKEAADKFAARTAENAKVYPGLLAAAEKSLAAVKVAEAALQKAREAAFRAEQARAQESISYTTERNEFESAMRDSASPEIAAFVRNMWDECDAARKQLTTVSRTTRNLLTGGAAHETFSNSESIGRRIAACRQAIAAAEALALEPDQSGVAAALSALRAKLPKIEDPKFPENMR